ncbi:MAG: hypothetical protein KJ731_12230 [Alphaproteobacteria bacterium]|nr:hypothetical protein [Alphaproteobacteria bacterium]MBU1278933.1 hypothetical protein [Alphaproteobacteria bacterium]MBU1574063.1 hypothetical protein [Alphaproteobacteria bacterium]MBU1829220.1 hypothetical protein [Alphaproteobacteria bacterium]MBU2078625.1 hypothetical protein [Alphaproteobacteria bacterium]
MPFTLPKLRAGMRAQSPLFALIDRVKSSWEAGPPPHWTDHMHQTRE